MTDSADSALAADRAEALRLIPVSRETEARLQRLVDLLIEAQKRTNLIAPSTIPKIWTRHIADSLQLLALAPDARIWVDLGSGAGFPGLAIACALADRPGTEVHLVESTGKKANFLREAARETGAPAIVHGVRIEDFVQNWDVKPDVVTARALAPLPTLLGLAHPLLKRGGQGLFMKGQDVGAELTEATQCWKFQPVLVPSKTSPESRIVVIPHLAPRGPQNVR
jgi:16S rRNA (guanine527-N7)-methyltransferase